MTTYFLRLSKLHQELNISDENFQSSSVKIHPSMQSFNSTLFRHDFEREYQIAQNTPINIVLQSQENAYMNSVLENILNISKCSTCLKVGSSVVGLSAGMKLTYCPVIKTKFSIMLIF